jgi:hypothetical protein
MITGSYHRIHGVKNNKEMVINGINTAKNANIKYKEWVMKLAKILGFFCFSIVLMYMASCASSGWVTDSRSNSASSSESTAEEKTEMGGIPEVVLEEGESLYSGKTKLEKCDSITVSFVLSADKTIIKNISVDIQGIYVVNSRNNTTTKINTTSSYGGTCTIEDGVFDFAWGFSEPDFRLIVKDLVEGKAIGEVNYVFEVNRNQKEDLGTSSIAFEKVK